MALGMLRERGAAEDLTQEVFLKAYRHLGNFQGASSFYTWLYRITTNLCIDQLRKSRRFVEVELEDQAFEGSAEMVAQPLGFDPARAFADREIRERVLRALDMLSPNHRAAILLREAEGLSYEEIAETMGCSLGTVMSRLFHARKRMQAELSVLVEPAAAEEGR